MQINTPRRRIGGRNPTHPRLYSRQMAAATATTATAATATQAGPTGRRRRQRQQPGQSRAAAQIAAAAPTSGTGQQSERLVDRSTGEAINQDEHETDRPTDRPTNRPTDRPTDLLVARSRRAAWVVEQEASAAVHDDRVRAAWRSVHTRLVWAG